MGLLASLMPVLAQPAQASDTVTRWDSFSESSTCGEPYTRTPYVSKSGGLSNSEPILGPFGTYFGRTVGEVRTKLVWWTVPGSGGQRIQVHKSMLPDLKEVADGLAAHANKGRVYRITSVAGFTPRTIGGAHQLSRHALGLAIDINPGKNPFRADNRLITNMPSWFVDTWRDAGFCWGGDWKYSKDPMHFSWLGPGSSLSVIDSITPLPPRTSRSSFAGRDALHATEFAPVMSRYSMGVLDATGNGAPDVVGLRSHPNGSVIDFATSTYGYGQCSVGRWFVEDRSVADSDLIVFGDIDGDTGQDLIALSAAGAKLQATVATRREEFGDITSSSTGLDSTSTAVAAGDFDGDGNADLWEATSDGRIRVWRGSNMTELIHESSLPGGVPVLISAGDRDGGDTPELSAVYDGGSQARLDVLSLSGTWSRDQAVTLSQTVSEVAALGSGDYDGDGRSDVQVLDVTGSMHVYVGNTSTGVPSARWFLRPNWECDDEPILLSFNGIFFDDDDSIFESNIEAIAAGGVTKGCNPPFNDRFCPDLQVSRETMAAFLVRALGLNANTHPGFVDVPSGSLFEEDIGRLATAGITRGCNPPANDRFCPKDTVTRQTMAAFLVRALDLKSNEHTGFIDVAPGNIFAVDIGRLATAGITKGCNPPKNDMFCPNEVVTRETMAAFLDRAGLGG